MLFAASPRTAFAAAHPVESGNSKILVLARWVLEIEIQSRGYGATSGKADFLSEERRRLDAADCANLSTVQEIPDRKIPDDPRPGKIDAADLNRATLTASDLGSTDIAGGKAGS